MNTQENQNLYDPLDRVEISSVKGYMDVPDIVFDIKEEILDQEISESVDATNIGTENISRVNMEWNEEKVLLLIHEYKKNELLWKAKHPHHFNKVKKQGAWSRIAKKLNVDIEECKKKMNSILSSLRREKAKIRKSRVSGVASDAVYESSWFAFKSLLFLCDRDEYRTSSQNTTVDKESDKQQEEESILSENLRDTAEDLPENVSENVASYSAESVASNSPNCHQSVRRITPPYSTLVTKRKRTRSVEDCRLNKMFKILETSRTSETENDAFGKLVARKLQRYTSTACTNVQQAIMQILFDADRGKYNNDSNLPPYQFHGYDQPHFSRFNLDQPPVPYQATSSCSIPTVPTPQSFPNTPISLSPSTRDSQNSDPN